MEKFINQLKKINLRIKSKSYFKNNFNYVIVMEGDGNCLFRGFADQIEGNEGRHEYYREQAILYMIENKDHFENYIEDDVKFDSYIDEMKKDGKWGGNLEIYVIK